MLGWFGKRRKERQALEFMLKFISYNTRLTAVSANPETRQHHLHQQGARLHPIVPLAAGENYRSWLGGCPHLPEPFSWPQRDGKPLHFLGQIDCAALPPDIWGGLGPRTGWLAFFVGMAERICAEVIHAPQLGPKRTPPAKSRFYFLPSMLGAVPEVYDEIPHWPVDVVAWADGAPDPYQSIVKNPALHPEIDLGQAQFQPYDWDTFLALLKTAKASALHNIEFNTQYLRSSLARTSLPKPDLAVREQVLDAATQMRERFEKINKSRPFDQDLWQPFAQEVAAWRKAMGAAHLEEDRHLSGKSRSLAFYADELLAVCAGRLTRHPVVARKLKRISERASVLSSDAELDALLKEVHKDNPPDGMIWPAFEKKFPEQWRRRADELNEMESVLYDAEVILRPVECRPPYPNGSARGPWGGSDPFGNSYPESWEEAGQRVDRLVGAAQDNLHRLSQQNPDLAPRLQRCRDAIAANEQIERSLAALVGKADVLRAAPFLVTQWVDALTMVQAPEIGERHWTTEYDAVRYRLAALAYSRDPASLPDTVRSYFEARWNNDRNYEIASMGGLPHGWSYDMLENVDTRVMLLELPTSNMFGWQWGDVNNVVLSLPADELRGNIYRGVRCDITN
jgi:hypothetical protein